MEGLAGVTAMDCSVAEVTVNTVEPLVAPWVALMVVVPAATVLARPFEPVALEIVAAAAMEEAQVTWVGRAWVGPSRTRPAAWRARGGAARGGVGGAWT